MEKLDFISISTDDEVELSKLYAQYGLYIAESTGFNRTGHAEQFCEVMERPALKDLVIEITHNDSKMYLGVYHIVKNPPEYFKYKHECISKAFMVLTLFLYENNEYHKIVSGCCGMTANGGLSVDYDFKSREFAYVAGWSEQSKEIEKEYIEHLWNDMYNTFISINLAMLDTSSQKYIEKTRTMKLKPLSQINSKAPGKVRLNVFKVKEYIAHKVATKHSEKVWNCPAWGVRGHYRKCKSGKTVYVKPYVKGQHKEEYKGRIYEL